MPLFFTTVTFSPFDNVSSQIKQRFASRFGFSMITTCTGLRKRMLQEIVLFLALKEMLTRRPNSDGIAHSDVTKIVTDSIYCNNTSICSMSSKSRVRTNNEQAR